MLSGTLISVTPNNNRAVLPTDSKFLQVLTTINAILIYVLLCAFQFRGKKLTFPPSSIYVELHSF